MWIDCIFSICYYTDYQGGLKVEIKNCRRHSKPKNNNIKLCGGLLIGVIALGLNGCEYILDKPLDLDTPNAISDIIYGDIEKTFAIGEHILTKKIPHEVSRWSVAELSNQKQIEIAEGYELLKCEYSLQYIDSARRYIAVEYIVFINNEEVIATGTYNPITDTYEFNNFGQPVSTLEQDPVKTIQP